MYGFFFLLAKIVSPTKELSRCFLSGSLSIDEFYYILKYQEHSKFVLTPKSV